VVIPNVCNRRVLISDYTVQGDPFIDPLIGRDLRMQNVRLLHSAL